MVVDEVVGAVVLEDFSTSPDSSRDVADSSVVDEVAKPAMINAPVTLSAAAGCLVHFVINTSRV